MQRRTFLTGATAGLSASLLGCRPPDQQDEGLPPPPPPPADDKPAPPRTAYDGPNVVLIRFGGGVRRQETIANPAQTWCPFIVHELGARKDDKGKPLEQRVLFPNMEIASAPGVVTSHGQGTLYLLTGQYAHYEDIEKQAFAERFEPKAPTIFEYFRARFDVPEHQALIINGEDRVNEEFYTFSNHHLYGVRYRSTVLSLYRFKTYLLRQELARGQLSDQDRAAKEKQLHDMEAKDYRVKDPKVVSPELDAFWESWSGYYGSSGLRNPRGDRVLTALALRALQRLRPRLLMINYQDPDYVHWGNRHFYTRAISIIDEGVREIYSAVQADEEYRDRTVFVVVPDCGRDSNRMMSVPYQHHFGSRSSHEIFALIAGPKDLVQGGRAPQDRRCHQISIARTIGEIMGFPTPLAAAESLL